MYDVIWDWMNSMARPTEALAMMIRRGLQRFAWLFLSSPFHPFQLYNKLKDKTVDLFIINNKMYLIKYVLK